MIAKILLIVLLCSSPVFAESSKSPSWVANLNAARDAEQLAVVSGTRGSSARFSFHEKVSGEWQEIVTCPAFIGKKGWGKTREGDSKTPKGIYTFTMAFGINPDPGCAMGYTQVDNSHYWVGDSSSEYYNQFISTNEHGGFNLSESEHIIDYDTAYKYCLNISYNIDGIPNKGSAIFLHCQTKNKFTAGCVAIPEDAMLEVLKHVKEGCVVVMDTSKNIKSY